MLSAATNGRRLCGRYTLIERLGAGGQGEVWRARDESRGVDLALKVLSPALARSDGAWMALEREYQVANALDHPAILKVHPPQRDGESAVLPMEIATGGDLRRLRGTSYLEIVPVLMEIAQALEHAHERGIVHRDLKPSNVLFDSRGRVRLADFGVAAGLALSSQRDAIRSGMSPFTASPEQLRGEQPAISDDVYGLGALAYELLSGYPPYYPKFDLKRVLEEPVPEIRPVHQAPPRLLSLVMAMLSKKPSMRPHTMRDVLDDLDATLNDTLTFDFDDEAAEAENADVEGAISASFDDDEDEDDYVPAPPPQAAKPTPPADASPTSGSARTASVQAKDGVPSAPVSDEHWPTTASKDLPPASPSGERVPATASRDATAASVSSERMPGSAAKGVTPGTVERSPGPAPQVSPPGVHLRAPAAKDATPAAAASNVRLPPSASKGPPPAASADEGMRAAASSKAAPPSAVMFTENFPAEAMASGNNPALNSQQAAIAAERAALERAAAALGATVASSRAALRIGDIPMEDTPRRAGGDRRISDGSISDRGSRDPSFDVGSDIDVGSSHSINASTFDDIKIAHVPKALRLEPMRQRRWVSALLILLVGIAAVGAFFVLPEMAEKTKVESPAVASAPVNDSTASPSVTPPTSESPSAAPPTANNAPPLDNRPTESVSAPEAAPAVAESDVVQKMNQARADFDDKLAALDARAAGVWGSKEYADAKARSAEANGARDAGDPALAATRLQEGLRLLGVVESKAPRALEAQLTAGDRALETGNAESAKQAYQFATRIDPRNQRAAEGLKRAQNLDRVLPLLADASNAESAKNFTRAAKAYNDVLAIEPNNAKARAGLTRTSSASGVDSYEKAIGTGFAALSAGRLQEAQSAFGQALAIRQNGREAQDGLSRVNAALRAQGYSAVRLRASSLETEERWGEALDEYEAVLKNDPSLVFAQQGRQRAAMRKDLSDRLQFLIDDPQRLAAPAVRSEASRLLDLADAQSPSGPVLRSQVSRLNILLPEFDKPVRLALESDNTTQVAIQRVGSFGTFARREIELKPGKYTVVGTRAGYRDVRRDVMIAPGQDVQIINIRCVEPI